MTFQEFLNYMAGPGVNAAVGFILSFLVEYWPYFGELSPKYKRLVFFALSFVIPLVAVAVSVAMGYKPLDMETFWQAVVAGFMASGMGTLAHTRDLPSFNS